jgi:UDP-N-acetylmuramoylalanine--D-glutamate ligase
MGGRDKGGDYALMADTVSQYARKIILIGEAAQAIESAFGKKIPCERASSLAEAVEKAVKAADPDTPVLLSPACSSFDMFANYKDRGLQFRNLVAALSASGGIS